MVVAAVVDGAMRQVGRVGEALTSPFSDTVVRLGVTGLSRAGKTVFITSLVANLLDRGRMPQLSAAASGRVRGVYLQPQPDDTLPRFPYEDHIARLTSATPDWPDGTRQISELRLSFRVQPSGLLSGFSGPRTVHLDIVDYPGEWLLDLGLMDLTFDAWSAAVLDRMAGRAQAEPFLAALSGVDPAQRLDEPQARDLARAFTGYLVAARAAGYADCTPGRFVLPGDLAGSPVLTFAPLRPGTASKPWPRGSLGRECARRFEAYKSRVVTPFFRDHFARIDRQIVLVDVLGAIAGGPRALEDLRRAMADILGAFRTGRNGWLSRLRAGRRVDRILFAATKADHLHHAQHGALTDITQALLREARDRASFSGARTQAMSIAALRTTVEETVQHGGADLDVVRGRALDTGRQVAAYPGLLPTDPAHLLSPAREGALDWTDAAYSAARFAPARLTLKPGEGPPHIRLDRAAEFLFGDKL